MDKRALLTIMVIGALVEPFRMRRLLLWGMMNGMIMRGIDWPYAWRDEWSTVQSRALRLGNLRLNTQPDRFQRGLGHGQQCMTGQHLLFDVIIVTISCNHVIFTQLSWGLYVPRIANNASNWNQYLGLSSFLYFSCKCLRCPLRFPKKFFFYILSRLFHSFEQFHTFSLFFSYQFFLAAAANLVSYIPTAFSIILRFTFVLALSLRCKFFCLVDLLVFMLVDLLYAC